MKPSQPSQNRNMLALAGWLGLCFSAALTGIFISPGGWYASLHKPLWNPPAWIFGPVWTLLYIMMAVAAWLVWCKGGWKEQGRALGMFLLQWLLNALWTPLFFGLHYMGLAFAEIILLWLALATTLVLFWQVRRLAGMLLIPYLAWASFAAVLNFTLWQLNP